MSRRGRYVHDEHMEVLNQFVNLETLVIGSESLTDLSMEHIANIPNLRAVVISGTKITDAGITRLAGHERLEAIGLFETLVSSDATSQLRVSLPKALIENNADYAGNTGFVPPYMPPALDIPMFEIFDANGCLTSDFMDRHFN